MRGSVWRRDGAVTGARSLVWSGARVRIRRSAAPRRQHGTAADTESMAARKWSCSPVRAGKQRLSMLKRAGLAKTAMASREVGTGPGEAAPGVDFPRLARSGFELSTPERSRSTAILHHAARRARRGLQAAVE